MKSNDGLLSESLTDSKLDPMLCVLTQFSSISFQSLRGNCSGTTEVSLSKSWPWAIWCSNSGGIELSGLLHTCGGSLMSIDSPKILSI